VVAVVGITAPLIVLLFVFCFRNFNLGSDGDGDASNPK
jgi:hypothetical protein